MVSEISSAIASQKIVMKYFMVIFGRCAVNKQNIISVLILPRGKAYCRGEKSPKLNQVLPKASDNIRHPYKLLEKKLDYMIELLESKSALGKQGLSHDD
jgi:hypothetical protein